MLSISAPDTFGPMHVAPAIPEFLARFPGVAIDISLCEVRTRIEADEQEPGAAVAHAQAYDVSRIGEDGSHGDVQKFSERLVDILKPQLRCYLGGTEFKTKLSGSRMNFCV
jgi:DNA-binding transcriptional LysR family regulator